MCIVVDPPIIELSFNGVGNTILSCQQSLIRSSFGLRACFWVVHIFYCAILIGYSAKSFLIVFIIIFFSVAEPVPVEPKLFWDLEPKLEINFNKHFLQSVWRMLE